MIIVKKAMVFNMGCDFIQDDNVFKELSEEMNRYVSGSLRFFAGLSMGMIFVVF